MLCNYLQELLISVFDLFGEFDSFGGYNNVMLCCFLDMFGFEYEFISVIEFYKFGQFDEILLCVVEKYDVIMEVMLVLLCEECQ